LVIKQAKHKHNPRTGAVQKLASRGIVLVTRALADFLPGIAHL